MKSLRLFVIALLAGVVTTVSISVVKRYSEVKAEEKKPALIYSDPKFDTHRIPHVMATTSTQYQETIFASLDIEVPKGLTLAQYVSSNEINGLHFPLTLDMTCNDLVHFCRDTYSRAEDLPDHDIKCPCPGQNYKTYLLKVDYEK